MGGVRLNLRPGVNLSVRRGPMSDGWFECSLIGWAMPGRISTPSRSGYCPERGLGHCPGTLALLPISTNAQGISHSIDIVEPRSDQGNLQNAFVVKSDAPQSLMILG